MTTVGAPGSPARRWAEQLAAWEIDPDILASVTESPWGLPPELFAAEARSPAPAALHRLAREVLRPGGTVLDVGAGAGAAGLPVVPAGGRLMAVDSQPSMLRALEDDAGSRGVAVTSYDGGWPEVAPQVPVCDVVLCANVLYNVPDLVPFVTALTEHARELVVVEIMGQHPLVRLGPMWQALHHQPRPSGPTAELAIEVLRAAGIDPRVEEEVREPAERTGAVLEAWVEVTRRQLCLPAARRDEVAELMRRHPPRPKRVVTLAWPGEA